MAKAAREAGMAAVTSRDAGSYLCNYLCWRAGEATLQPGGPLLVAFVHVPLVARSARRQPAHGLPFTMADLVRAGGAIVRTAVAAARAPSLTG
jgi:pyroglutamyl-peptidase